jgi:hypothetical protein
MRCLIGFFGLTRSLRHTADSIRVAFYGPLRELGVPIIRAGHFNLPATIDNPRSGEFGIAPDRSESALLELDLCWIEAQDDRSISSELAAARRFPDLFQDQYRSLRNLCHQLRSLACLWSLLELQGVEDDDLILLLRPDLLYLDVLDPATQLQPIVEGSADLIVPGWQSWGGLNDRFAFCTKRAARIYANRIKMFQTACQMMRGMHSETYLKLVIQGHGLRAVQTPFRAVRLRANGQIAANDIPMTTAFLSSSQATSEEIVGK